MGKIKGCLDRPLHHMVKEFGDGRSWFMLQHLVRRTTIRAARIDKHKRTKDYDGHEIDEAKAKGNIKCEIITWEI